MNNNTKENLIILGIAIAGLFMITLFLLSVYSNYDLCRTKFKEVNTITCMFSNKRLVDE